nr:sulfatase/phosphatase domain-containing protein [Streptomyces sp. WAC 06738]
MQGRSLTPLFGGRTPKGWRRSMYYRYWMHDDSAHHVRAHYGVRTERYKLIFYYGEGLGVPGASDRVFPPEWELFDLHNDPDELHNVYDHPAHAQVRAGLERELARLQRLYGDQPAPAQAAA